MYNHVRIRVTITRFESIRKITFATGDIPHPIKIPANPLNEIHLTQHTQPKIYAEPPTNSLSTLTLIFSSAHPLNTPKKRKEFLLWSKTIVPSAQKGICWEKIYSGQDDAFF